MTALARLFLALSAIALAALAALPALAQGLEIPPVPDPLAAALPGLAASVAAVTIIVEALRRGVPRVFAPGESTDLSRLANLILCFALGVALGAFGVAPAVPAGSLAGQIIGGILAGSLAMAGRNLGVWGLRAVEAAKAPPEPKP